MVSIVFTNEKYIIALGFGSKGNICLNRFEGRSIEVR